jgi:hypothetical protein
MKLRQQIILRGAGSVALLSVSAVALFRITLGNESFVRCVALAVIALCSLILSLQLQQGFWKGLREFLKGVRQGMDDFNRLL